MNQVFGRVAVAGLLLCVPRCSPSGPRENPAEPLELSLGEVREVPVSDRPTAFFETESALVLAAPAGEVERILASTDDGVTWAVRGTLPLVPRVWAAHDGCADLHRVENVSDGLIHVGGLDGDRPRSRIADSIDVALRSLTIGSDQCFGAVWIALGRGWPELMFSQSVDHGASWSPPVRVNTESRRKEVAHSVLLRHRGGWVLLWTENRDARTLFDVYASFSPDGREWSPSRRVNDDEVPSFNVDPVAVEDGRAVHVLSQDYREINRFGDRDGNIYYARLADDGAPVPPNVRVNDVADGPQSGAALARDPETGGLVAAWFDSRNRLTGDVYASASRDGRLWSPNRRVNVNARPEGTDRPWLAPRRAGGVHVGWVQSHRGVPQGFVRRITLGPWTGNTAPEEPVRPTLGGPLSDPLPQRQLLAEARFEGDSADQIEPIAGSWIVRDGVLLSFGSSPAFAKWAVAPPADFVLEGRFRLDRRQHKAAQLFLRVRDTPEEPDAFDGYWLRNHFRMGVLLSHSRAITGTGERKPSVVVEPLTDRWFPLRQDVWYPFRAVVVGRRLDYWVDGQWMLSHDALDPRPGAIVLGTDASAPVEWDDLRLYSLDSSQAASSR